MKIKLLIIGKIKELIYKEKIKEYIKWINKDVHIEMVILKDKNKNHLVSKISKYISYNIILCSLSEDGLSMNSKKFSKFIYNSNKDLIFLIGGPDGFPKIIKEKSNHVISLSSLTFTHEMSILIIAEQIFRAISIHKNSKYHRE